MAKVRLRGNTLLLLNMKWRDLFFFFFWPSPKSVAIRRLGTVNKSGIGVEGHTQCYIFFFNPAARQNFLRFQEIKKNDY